MFACCLCFSVALGTWFVWFELFYWMIVINCYYLVYFLCYLIIAFDYLFRFDGYLVLMMCVGAFGGFV